MLSHGDLSLLITVSVLFGVALLLVGTYLGIILCRRTKKRGGEEEESQQKPVTSDTSANIRPLSCHMRRFLSIVEHELDIDAVVEASDETKKKAEEAGKSGEARNQDGNSRAEMVFLEVKKTNTTKKKQVEVDDDVEEEDKSAADDDSEDDGTGSQRGIVIDRTRLCPQIDVENFVS